MLRVPHFVSSRPVAIGAIGATIAAIALVGGCKSDPNDVSLKGITSNMTPELQGLAERPSDVDRNMAVTFDTNGRLFWGDLGRVWMTDNPSILSPYPIISTGGQP